MLLSRSSETSTVYSRTPLRISFGGGGTDFPEYFANRRRGKILSTAIDQYVHVNVRQLNSLFDGNFRLQYSEVENCDRIEDIRNDIIRGVLLALDWNEKVCISVVSDVPGNTGLGSSSAFCVGLISALTRLKGIKLSRIETLAMAVRVELDILQRPMGIQDYLPAIFGGTNFFTISSRTNIGLNPVSHDNGIFQDVMSKCYLIWTGQSRDSSSVLSEQQKSYPKKLKTFDTLAQIAEETYQIVVANDPEGERLFYKKITQGQILKEKFSDNIVSEPAGQVISTLKEVGNNAFRVVGAGNGGFVLAFLEPEQYQAFKVASNLKVIKPRVSNSGSQIIYEE